MNPAHIFLPSVALVLVTYSVLLYMFRGRAAAMKKHGARIQALSDPEYEENVFSEIVSPSENFENLFEMPVLFFAASIIIFSLARVDGLYLVLCWLYVIARALHSYVHCTNKKVRHRFRSFGVSVIILLIIWIRLGAQILMS